MASQQDPWPDNPCRYQPVFTDRDRLERCHAIFGPDATRPGGRNPSAAGTPCRGYSHHKWHVDCL